jgi:hypothetical protein
MGCCRGETRAIVIDATPRILQRPRRPERNAIIDAASADASPVMAKRTGARYLVRLQWAVGLDI